MEKTQGQNNGGHNPFYHIPPEVNNVDKLARHINANPAIFNIMKATFGINVCRHKGTDQMRDSKKILHYAIENIIWVDRTKTIPDIIVQLIQEAVDEDKSEIINRLVNDKDIKPFITKLD